MLKGKGKWSMLFPIVLLVLTLFLSSINGPTALASGRKITIGIVQWACTVPPAHLVKYVIEKYFGNPVDLKIVSKEISYAGVARGDFDLTFSVWLPNADFRHIYRFRQDLETLPTPYYYNAVLGLYVPDYCPEKSIAELADPEVAKKYGSEIIGIDPGSSLVTMTRENVIPGYGLGDLYKLISASGPAMTAALGKAYRKKEPIVVTLWTPHWVFAKYDMRILEDPKGLYGGVDWIYMAIHEGFRQEFPEIARFLTNLELNTIDFVGAGAEHPEKYAHKLDYLAEMMLMIEEGLPLDEVAEEWVSEHESVVKEWISGK